MLVQPLLRRSRTMKCLLTQSLLHFPVLNFPISAANIGDSSQILRLPPFFCVRGFLCSNSRINLRGYCSNSVTGLKSMATARIVQDPESISYLNQREAAEIDEILMGPLGFSVDQLMELAGLSVAASIAEYEWLELDCREIPSYIES